MFVNSDLIVQLRVINDNNVKKLVFGAMPLANMLNRDIQKISIFGLLVAPRMRPPSTKH